MARLFEPIYSQLIMRWQVSEAGVLPADKSDRLVLEDDLFAPSLSSSTIKADATCFTTAMAMGELVLVWRC